MRIVAPSYTDRVTIVGKTGSGKTTLARRLLEPRPYVVVCDTKGTLQWPGYTRFDRLDDCIYAKTDVAPRIIYAPRHEELIDPSVTNRFFQWLYLRGNTTVYIDEVYGVCTRGEIPTFYHAILTRGRELNISTFSSTQRPKQIPAVVLSESEHYYVFQLMLPQDRQRIREMIPVTDEQLRALRRHEFFYATADGGIMGPAKLSV